MKVLPKRPVAFRRCIAFALSSLFLLFLSLSQPHRVHHFFQRLGHTHDDTQVDSDNHDHAQDQTKPAQTDCVLQSVAQNCQLGQVELVGLRFVESLFDALQPTATTWVDLFSSFPFFQRAPPRETLFS
jgi:hypothetical protein